MPARKPARKPVALRYLGDASGVPHISGIPSRDLSAADVRRLAHRHGLTVTAFAALATASGVFTEAASANPAADESPSADGKETHLG